MTILLSCHNLIENKKRKNWKNINQGTFLRSEPAKYRSSDMFPLVPELLPSFTLLNKAKRDDQLNIINSHLGAGHEFKNQDIYTAKAEDLMFKGLLYNIVRAKHHLSTPMYTSPQ